MSRSTARASARSGPEWCDDLVVAEQVDVDRRAALGDVVDHALHRHVAADDGRERAQQGVDPAPRGPAARPPRRRCSCAARRSRATSMDDADQRPRRLSGPREVADVARRRGDPPCAGRSRSSSARPARRRRRTGCRSSSRCRRAGRRRRSGPARSPPPTSGGWTRRPRPVALSTQRNAGMSSVEPWRIPHWLTPVCDDQPVSQRDEAVPSRRAASGRWSGQSPERSARRSNTSWATPSSWTNTMPGTSVRAADFARRRATVAVRRSNHASSSIASSDETIALIDGEPDHDHDRRPEAVDA